jgi:hypothetical protein
MATGMCPVCDEALALDLPDWKVTRAWRDTLAHRARWVELSRAYAESRDLAAAALRSGITEREAERLLDFFAIEVCGCRRVTCPACVEEPAEP